MTQPRRYIYTCDKCGRTIVPKHEPREWFYWLYSDKPLAQRLIVRCPRHVTQWSMREAGWPRNRLTLKWLAQGHAMDTGPRPLSELAMPYPPSGPFKEIE